MDEILGIRTLITVAVSWGVFRTRLSSIGKAIEDTFKQLKQLWSKSDDINRRLAVLESKQQVISAMLDPKELKEQNMLLADFMARTDERLKHQEKDK